MSMLGNLAVCDAGELTCLRLMRIGLAAVEAAAQRQGVLEQADVADAITEVFGKPCQVCKFYSF